MRSSTTARRFFLVASACTLVGACATVRFVSEYDEVTDRGVTELEKMVDDTLGAIAKETAPACLYASHTQFYAAVRSAVRVLSVRNHLRGEKNALTSQQIDSLQPNAFDPLEQLHQMASRATPPRCMDPTLLAQDHQAIDQNLEAILKLELAKKRGR